MSVKKMPKKVKSKSVTKPSSVTDSKLTARMKKAFADKSKSQGATQKIYDTAEDKDYTIMKKGKKPKRGSVI